MRLIVTSACLLLIAAASACAETLEDATEGERATLERLIAATDWPRRALATMRLERYDGAQSLAWLERLRRDRAWQVRCFALRALSVRAEDLAIDLDDESHPRVVRCGLRHGATLTTDRLERGIENLASSSDLDLRLLAVELAFAAGDEARFEEATDTLKAVVNRMSRGEAGALAPRLSILTHTRGLWRPFEWRRWILDKGRGLELRDAPRRDPAPPKLAGLSGERFAALEDYLDTLHRRPLDLAICLDCTSSMSDELAAAQGGVTDLLAFVGDVVGGLRFGVVGYRDRGSRFTTKAWDFTADPNEAREHLWQLTADGGGDSREAVFEAMQLAYGKLSWRWPNPPPVDEPATEGPRLVLIVIGDAPPHVGFGTKCAEMAEKAGALGLTTHAIEVAKEPVDHFDAIAKAGRGRLVRVDETDTLIPQIAGLAMGEAFAEELAEFFELYLELCR